MLNNKFNKINFFIFFFGLILINCKTPSSFNYPSRFEREIIFICKYYFIGENTSYQKYKKLKPNWIFIGNEKIKLYFTNNTSTTLPKKLNKLLKQGVYYCPE